MKKIKELKTTEQKTESHIEDMESVIGKIVDHILDSSCIKNQREHEELFQKLKAMYSKDPENTFFLMRKAIQDLTCIMADVLNISKRRHDYIAEYIVNGAYKRFFSEFFKMTEGRTCCSDKACFVERMTIKALSDNGNYPLNASCGEKEEKTEAYWLPATVKDTNEAIQLFWDWQQLKLFFLTENALGSCWNKVSAGAP